VRHSPGQVEANSRKVRFDHFSQGSRYSGGDRYRGLRDRVEKGARASSYGDGGLLAMAGCLRGVLDATDTCRKRLSAASLRCSTTAALFDPLLHPQALDLTCLYSIVLSQVPVESQRDLKQDNARQWRSVDL